MKWKALALILLFLPASALGFPLQSSNGVVNCTIFGTFKDPGFAGYTSSDSNSVLVIDASLTRNNQSDRSPVQATYMLTDGNDRTYKTRSENIKELQNGRQLIGFVVARETIAKSLTIDLSQDSSGGDQFMQRFSDPSNLSNENVTILYYGLLRTSIASQKKMVELDVAITNNGTERLHLDAGNFTLKDQWGWVYQSKEYDSSSRKGIQSMVLEPNATIRSALVFSSLSPQSRPVELVYRYSDDKSMILDIDTEAGLVGSQDSCLGDKSADEVADSSLAGSIKATKARLAKVKKFNSSEEQEPRGNDEL